MTNKNRTLPIDQVTDHLVRKNYPLYLSMSNEQAVEYAINLFFQTKPFTSDRAYCLQKIIAVIDNPDAKSFSRIKFLEKMANAVRKLNPMSKRDLLPSEQKIVIEKIADHAESSNHPPLQRMALKMLGKIVNDPENTLSFKDFNAYTNILSKNLGADNIGSKTIAFAAMQKLIRNHENGLSYKMRIHYAADMISILQKQVFAKPSNSTSENTAKLLDSVGSLSKDHSLFSYGLNYAFNSLKEEDSKVAIKHFQENISLLKDRSSNQYNYKDETAWAVLNNISYDTKNGFVLNCETKPFQKMRMYQP